MWQEIHKKWTYTQKKRRCKRKKSRRTWNSCLKLTEQAEWHWTYEQEFCKRQTDWKDKVQRVTVGGKQRKIMSPHHSAQTHWNEGLDCYYITLHRTTEISVFPKRMQVQNAPKSVWTVTSSARHLNGQNKISVGMKITQENTKTVFFIFSKEKEVLGNSTLRDTWQLQSQALTQL